MSEHTGSAWNVEAGEKVAGHILDRIVADYDEGMGTWSVREWAQATRDTMNEMDGMDGDDVKALFAWAYEWESGWELASPDPFGVVASAMETLYAER